MAARRTADVPRPGPTRTLWPASAAGAPRPAPRRAGPVHRAPNPPGRASTCLAHAGRGAARRPKGQIIVDDHRDPGRTCRRHEFSRAAEQARRIVPGGPARSGGEQGQPPRAAPRVSGSAARGWRQCGLRDRGPGRRATDAQPFERRGQAGRADTGRWIRRVTVRVERSRHGGAIGARGCAGSPGHRRARGCR